MTGFASADSDGIASKEDAMRHAPSTLHFSHAFRSATPAGAIEWEELPSLAGSLSARLVGLGRRLEQSAMGSGASPWDATRPAALERDRPATPFREPMQGMAVREVEEPDLFRHFFGA